MLFSFIVTNWSNICNAYLSVTKKEAKQAESRVAGVKVI